MFNNPKADGRPLLLGAALDLASSSPSLLSESLLSLSLLSLLELSLGADVLAVAVSTSSSSDSEDELLAYAAYVGYVIRPAQCVHTV